MQNYSAFFEFDLVVLKKMLLKYLWNIFEIFNKVLRKSSHKSLWPSTTDAVEKFSHDVSENTFFGFSFSQVNNLVKLSSFLNLLTAVQPFTSQGNLNLYASSQLYGCIGVKKENIYGTKTGKYKEKLGRKFNELYIALTGKEILQGKED